MLDAARTGCVGRPLAVLPLVLPARLQLIEGRRQRRNRPSGSAVQNQLTRKFFERELPTVNRQLAKAISPASLQQLRLMGPLQLFETRRRTADHHPPDSSASRRESGAQGMGRRGMEPC